MHGRSHNLAIIFLLAGLIQCSPKHPIEPARGVQVGGGGSGLYSTPEQVNAALDQAFDLISRIPQKNIIVQFWLDQGVRSKDPRIKTPTHIFPNLASNGQSLDSLTNPSSFESPMLKALKTNRVSRLSLGDCLNTATELHKEASVSAFNLSADVCFSIGDLTRIPPSALLREVLSLVLHEATHMGGGDESEAVAWQQEFSAYFGLRFGDVSSDTVTDPTRKSFSEIQILLDHAEQAAKENPNDPSIFSRVGKIADELQRLPYANDPLALELKMRPPHPELIDNYSGAVLALTEKITGIFNIQHRPVEAIAMVESADQLPSILSTLKEIERDFNQINENFQAFSSVTSVARSACVTPKDARGTWIQQACFKAN